MTNVRSRNWHKAYNPRIPFIIRVWKKKFSSTLSVCDPLNLFLVGGRSFFQYGDSVRSFANVLFIKYIIFAYKYMNPFISLFHRPHILWSNSIFSAKQSSGSAVFDPVSTPTN